MTNKNKIEQLRQKLYNKKKELQVEEADQVLKDAEKDYQDTLTHSAYDVFQDPTKKGRHFLMVEVKYNPETMEAIVTDVRNFEDKTAGLSFVIDKDNRKYLFNKCKRSQK